MPKQLPKISDAEWTVIKVLWEEGALPSSQIVRELKKSTKWNPKTIHTLLSRLVEKGAVRAEKEEGSAFYLYSPLVSEDECVKEETQSFLEKVYDGSFRLLVSKFVADQKLSEQEIEELKRILDEGKEG